MAQHGVRAPFGGGGPAEEKGDDAGTLELGWGLCRLTRSTNASHF